MTKEEKKVVVEDPERNGAAPGSDDFMLEVRDDEVPSGDGDLGGITEPVLEKQHGYTAGTSSTEIVPEKQHSSTAGTSSTEIVEEMMHGFASQVDQARPLSVENVEEMMRGFAIQVEQARPSNGTGAKYTYKDVCDENGLEGDMSTLRRFAECRNGVESKIHKVPAICRGVNGFSECYDPVIVAIGPYHYDKPELKEMESLKIKFALEYVEESEKSIKDLFEEEKEFWCSAKKYYDEDVTKAFDGNLFAYIMFLDSCFVIQFIDSVVTGRLEGTDIKYFQVAAIIRDIMLLENQLPYVILARLMSLSLRFDENKGEKMIDKFIKGIMNVPCAGEEGGQHGKKTPEIFGLRNIFDVAKNYFARRPKILSRKFLSPKLFCSKFVGLEIYGPERTGRMVKMPIHLLELVRFKFVDDKEIIDGVVGDNGIIDGVGDNGIIDGVVGDNRIIDGVVDNGIIDGVVGDNRIIDGVVDNRIIDGVVGDKGIIDGFGNELSFKWSSYRSVKELKSVGVHFEPSESCRFSDITFESKCLFGRLRLPPIVIGEETKSLLLNLVAFESCAGSNFEVSSYVYFMDVLIDRVEDVKELRSKGIIFNLLGSDEQVANLFNEISKNLIWDDFVFRRVKAHLNTFYESYPRLWFTEFLYNHFRSPWAVIAFFAAIVVLGLAIAQTVLSALQL